MAVSLFFGLPGCGKTTILTMLAYKAVKDLKYKNVYSNVRLKIPGVTYIDNDVIGKYGLENALILIDEATLFADNRDYANFTKERIIYFMEHRHFRVDIILFCQQNDGYDKKIRSITDRVYYVYKTWFFGLWFSEYYRIPYGIIIPDAKNGNQKLGEIIQGYCKPNIFIRIFSHKCYRPKYYKFFDSWELPKGFRPLPERYQPHIEYIDGEPVAGLRAYERMVKRRQRHKVLILLRSIPVRISAAASRLWHALPFITVKENQSSSH